MKTLTALPAPRTTLPARQALRQATAPASSRVVAIGTVSRGKVQARQIVWEERREVVINCKTAAKTNTHKKRIRFERALCDHRDRSKCGFYTAEVRFIRWCQTVINPAVLHSDGWSSNTESISEMQFPQTSKEKKKEHTTGDLFPQSFHKPAASTTPRQTCMLSFLTLILMVYSEEKWRIATYWASQFIESAVTLNLLQECSYCLRSEVEEIESAQ